MLNMKLQQQHGDIDQIVHIPAAPWISEQSSLCQCALQLHLVTINECGPQAENK